MTENPRFFPKSLSPVAQQELTGRRYRDVELLTDEGNSGVVYRALDGQNRRVVIKVATNPVGNGEMFREHEALIGPLGAVADDQDRKIMPECYDWFGVDYGARAALVMEDLSAQGYMPLSTVLEDRNYATNGMLPIYFTKSIRIPDDLATTIRVGFLSEVFLPVAHILAAAEQNGQAHRDLNADKIQHVWWHPQERRTRVIDWGNVSESHEDEPPFADGYGFATAFLRFAGYHRSHWEKPDQIPRDEFVLGVGTLFSALIADIVNGKSSIKDMTHFEGFLRESKKIIPSVFRTRLKKLAEEVATYKARHYRTDMFKMITEEAPDLLEEFRSAIASAQRT